MYGLASNVQQAVFDATTGAFTFSAGNGKLDANGMTITATSVYSGARAVNMKSSGGTLLSALYEMDDPGGGQHTTVLECVQVASTDGYIQLIAGAPTGKSSAITLQTRINSVDKDSIFVGANQGITIQGTQMVVGANLTVGSTIAPAAALDVYTSDSVTAREPDERLRHPDGQQCRESCGSRAL
jgi:hypothetical protein